MVVVAVVPVAGVAPVVVEAVPDMGPVVAAAVVVPATVLAGAVAKVGAVAADGAITIVVDMVGAAAMRLLALRCLGPLAEFLLPALPLLIGEWP